MTILDTARRILLRWFESPEQAGAKLAKKIRWGTARPGRLTVLCLSRSQFTKDIEELRRLTDINWVTLSAVKVKVKQEHWVPEADRQQSYFSTWLRQDRCRHIRPILTRFGAALLTEAQRHAPIDAVLAANMDYWQDEALKLGCQQLGIPFLVLCRENYTIPWTGPWLHNHVEKSGFSFDGDGIAVFSESTRAALVPAIPDPRNLWVTGAPRYDRWLEIPMLDADQRDHVSLITFNDPGYEAVDTFAEVMRIFDEVARREQGRGLTWLVKCKKRADRETILSRIGSTGDSPLDFQYDLPLFDLYPRSRVIVGYNSLALIEALLSDIPIVVPCWDQTRASVTQLLLDYNDPQVRRVINFVETPEELRALLVRAAAGEKLPTGSIEDRHAVFSRHLRVPGGADGKVSSSAATAAFVRHYVERARLAKAG